MIKIEHTDVYGWEHAIRGMRNPLNSWDKSDSFLCDKDHCWGCPLENCISSDFVHYIVGPNDLALAKKLAHAGTDHRKFMRMIVVYADITAPLYWFKEFDTYKIGTVANSCSTMHKIHTNEITVRDFSAEKLTMEFGDGTGDYTLPLVFESYIEIIESVRRQYVSTGDKKYWDTLIQLLPSSYNQRRTVLLNYEVLRNIYHARRNHKLSEWHDFCAWISNLPYSELITGEGTTT